jgi:hypothetical protein
MAYSYKGASIIGNDRLMHLGFQNNSYNVNAQVNYKIEVIIKQKTLRHGRYELRLSLLGTGVSLLEAWRLRIRQHLLLWLLLVASNGSYTI